MDTISILVVDDTRQNLVTLEAILEEPGLKVVGVSSAREALRRLLKQEFAAILLDVHMPDMDGFETASLIRQRPLSKHTPILFLTAYAVEAQLTKAYALGAVDYMPTPVQPDVLKAKVAVFADLYRKRLEVRRQAELLREAEARLRQQAEHALRQSEGRFQVLCTAAPVGIFQLDATGHCVYASPVWQTTTGGAPEEASGLAGPTSSATAAASRRWRRGRRRWTTARPGPANPGSRVRARRAGCTCAPARSSATTARPSAMSARSRTSPRGRSTEARLIEADRRKDEFLAMLAHELRNPLAAISSAVTVARTPQLERERNWSIAVIGRHVRHLEKLIDDLMDVSRITLGKIEMRRERLDLSVVLARAADAVRAQVADRHQQLDVALPAAPLWADVDPTRLEQVFVNLLGNASKYSHDGGRIWFSAHPGPCRCGGARARRGHRAGPGHGRAGVRPVRAGADGTGPRQRRARHRPVAGAAADGAARREHPRAQRRPRARRRVRRDAAAGGARSPPADAPEAEVLLSAAAVAHARSCWSTTTSTRRARCRCC